MSPYDIMSAIDHQLPLHITTFSECSTEDCENSARGGRTCLSCIIQQSKNPEITASLVDAARAKYAAYSKFIEAHAP